MAKYLLSALKSKFVQYKLIPVPLKGNFFHTTSINFEVQAAKTKISVLRDKPVSYERYYRPFDIGHRKGFIVWNNTTLKGGLRRPHTVFEDIFTKKFLEGTFHEMLRSEIIIKRQHNIIRIAFLLYPKIKASKLYFLIGYTEEMLGHVLQCPVKLEIQTIQKESDIVFNYI